MKKIIKVMLVTGFILCVYGSENRVYAQIQSLNSGESKITVEIVEEYKDLEINDTKREKEFMNNGEKETLQGLPKTGERSTTILGFIGLSLTFLAVVLKKWMGLCSEKKSACHH